MNCALFCSGIGVKANTETYNSMSDVIDLLLTLSEDEAQFF